MKEFNFNTLRDLPVPEQWIENALAIPETEEQKPAAVPFWRMPRYIAMAATLVLVSALSIALFLSMGSKPPVAVKPGSGADTTEIVWSTDEHGATVATEVIVVPDGNTDQGGISPTEPKSGLARLIKDIFGIPDNTSPTTATGSGRGRINSDAKTDPTEKGRTNPTERSGTTTKPGSTEGGKPSVTPTEAAYDPEPLNDPTESPAPRPTTAPTEAQLMPPTATPWFPEDPTELCGDDPTQPPAQPTEPPSYPRTISVRLNRNFSGVTEDSTVYVSVYDSDGNRLGDSDPFASQHIAQISVGPIYVTVSYTPGDILPQDGSYRYEVYNDRGKTLATGTAHLSA